MKQPELGRKIADLRKAKGYTQEELVERCNLSVRTLQRIESGEVEPRPHTLRVILTALEYEVSNQAGRIGNFMKKAGRLFNLKHNTMTKISALVAMAAITMLIWVSTASETNAQNADKVRAILEENSGNFVRWFNSGKVDSMMTLIHDDACLLAVGCGKDNIRRYYYSQVDKYKFDKFSVEDVSVCGDIAVEKGKWTVILQGGINLSGVYMTEWRKTKAGWLIINDISDTY